jgi:hypothetical protein
VCKTRANFQPLFVAASFGGCVTWRDAHVRDTYEVVAKYCSMRGLWKSSTFLLTTCAAKWIFIRVMRTRPQPVTGNSQVMHRFSSEGGICTR